MEQNKIAIIDEERIHRMEEQLQKMQEQLTNLVSIVDVMSQVSSTVIEGKAKIAKALGCAEEKVTELNKQHALGNLLWKPQSEARNTRLHLDNAPLARKRYVLWCSLSAEQQKAIAQLPTATYIEAYWQDHYHL